MQRFRFRLEGLLRLRSQLERAARRTLATATGAVTSVERQLEAAVSGMHECERLGCSTEPHAPLARAMAQGLARHRQQLTNQLRAAQAQLDRARGDWLDRRRDARALESLRQRRRGEWRLEQERREQLEMEELARRHAPAPLREVQE